MRDLEEPESRCGLQAGEKKKEHKLCLEDL